MCVGCVQHAHEHVREHVKRGGGGGSTGTVEKGWVRGVAGVCGECVRAEAPTHSRVHIFRPKPNKPQQNPTHIRCAPANVGVPIHQDQPPLAGECKAVRVAVVHFSQLDVGQCLWCKQLVALGKGQGSLAALNVSHAWVCSQCVASVVCGVGVGRKSAVVSRGLGGYSSREQVAAAAMRLARWGGGMTTALWEVV